MRLLHPQFKVRTWLQLTMLPALTVISVMIGVGLIFELRRLILAGFDQELQGVSAVTAAFVNPVDHAWLLEPPPPEAGPEWLEAREASPAYQRMVKPLQRTRDRLGLTYVYTQKVHDGDQITYGLDGTTGDEHSPLQTADELPADEVAGVARLIEQGRPHFTRLRRWDQWGLLKSSFVPIFDAEGKVIAMSGTDVNVSVIEARTRNALLLVFTVGSLALLAASAWSWRIARVLRRPVEDLKTGALRVAAGDYHELQISQPQELHRLAEDFNRVSREVKRTSEHFAAETARIVTAQNEREIRQRLAQSSGGANALASWPGVSLRADQRPGADALVESERALIWWFRPEAVPDRDAWRERSDMARRVAARWRGEVPANDAASWPDELAAVIVLNRPEQTWAVGFARAPAEGESWKIEYDGDAVRFGGLAIGWTLSLVGYAEREVVS